MADCWQGFAEVSGRIGQMVCVQPQGARGLGGGVHPAAAAAARPRDPEHDVRGQGAAARAHQGYVG